MYCEEVGKKKNIRTLKFSILQPTYIGPFGKVGFLFWPTSSWGHLVTSTSYKQAEREMSPFDLETWNNIRLLRWSTEVCVF